MTKNPIRAANILLEHGPHCMLVGVPADDMAKKMGLEIVPNQHFTTAFRQAFFEKRRQASREDWNLGTVGAVVLDRYGHLAAGGSTGGMSGMFPGRMSDTAVLGAGLFADHNIAVVWYVVCRLTLLS